MELTRHRVHGVVLEAVDVERPHLVDLCGGEGHAGREVTSVACCHDGCLLLHELKKRDTERWVEGGKEVWMGCLGESRGENGVPREVRGGQTVRKNIVSWEGVGERWEKGSTRGERTRRTEGGMYVEVDGWIVHGKYRESRAE